MMRRLYFLVPNAESCREVAADLKEVGVTEAHIHLIANDSQTLEEIPRAGPLATTELARGLEWGVGLGGTAGLLGGLLAVVAPPVGLALGGAALLGCAAAGAGFGALVSSLIAQDIPNHELEELERAIDAGMILLLVDVPRDEVEKNKSVIMERHPEARIGIAHPPQESPA